MENKNKLTKDNLLRNSFFIYSQLNPSTTSDNFWTTLIKEGKVDRTDFENARKFLLNLDTEAQLSVSNETQDRIWSKIKGSIDTLKKKQRNILLHPISIAACTTLVLFLSFAAYNHFRKIEPVKDIASFSISKDEIEKYKNSNDVLLVLSDKDTYIAQDGSTVNYSKEDIKIDGKAIAEQTEDLSYNQLIVPYGKRSSLVLQDGSKIWLNAGTHIIYPSKFEEKKREIYIKGEAYAEIARDEKAPFFIKTDDIEVEVLGTKFNINAYEGKNKQSVVLVEGSVSVKSTDKKKTILKPHQIFIQEGGKQLVENVSDINKYISWISGQYSFKDENLGFILDKLSDYYGVEIDYDLSVYSLKCSGGLDLKEDLTRVLNGLKDSTPTNYEYDAENNKYLFTLKKEKPKMN